jgi:hypothetical protein
MLVTNHVLSGVVIGAAVRRPGPAFALGSRPTSPSTRHRTGASSAADGTTCGWPCPAFALLRGRKRDRATT